MAHMLQRLERGPVLRGVLIPLSGQGKVRVTYNWLYSALNCDPQDATDFEWVLTKLDDQHVSLSPRDRYWGMTLYASVRDDWNWYLGVQAAHSADWITRVGRDEILGITGADLLTICLTGFNGQYVAVNREPSDHGGHRGYRLQSLGASEPNARTFFVGVTEVLQEGLALPLRSELTDHEVHQALIRAGVESPERLVQSVKAALS